MNLERAEERARAVRGHRAAARLYRDIEFELALGEPPLDLEDVGERSLSDLERRFPGVKEQAREIEEPPALSRRASRALHHPRCRILRALALCAAVGGLAALIARHFKRRPRHLAAAGVLVLIATTGQLSILGTAAVVAALVALTRRGYRPRMPAAPAHPARLRGIRPSVGPRAPQAPRRSRGAR